MKKFHIGAVILGSVLLIFLIWKIGLDALWRDLRVLGWGFVPFALIEGVSKLFHTIGWRYCLSASHARISFLKLFGFYLAGNSFNYITPTATIGGEVVKGYLLAGEHESAEAATGVIIDKLTFVLSEFSFAFIGSLFIIWKVLLPGYGYAALIITNVILLSGIIGFLVVQRRGKLGAVMRWLTARGIGGETLRRGAGQITSVDHALKAFYRETPRCFQLSLFWHFIALFISVFKTWYFLLLFSSQSLAGAAAIWLLSTWFDLLVFFIPFEIGLLEAIRVIVFNALGFSLALGLTYGIALRLEQILWVGVGLIIYAGLIPSKAKVQGSNFKVTPL